LELKNLLDARRLLLKIHPALHAGTGISRKFLEKPSRRRNAP
jgi:hypothetical protein